MSQPESPDPLHAFARETAETITREIFSSVMVPEVITSRIEAALRQAQQVQREAIVEEIEKQLDWLARQSYGVDVREKYKSTNIVMATVVSHSDAMHALLFVKQATRSQETPK